MTVKEYWFLFPVLFILVLGCLISTIVRTYEQDGAGYEKWTVVLAPILITITAFSGRFDPCTGFACDTDL